MLFLFDNLPLEDVIHETIMPMLDYESRIALNRCFVPNDRYISRFTKSELLYHELHVISNFLKYKLDNIESVDGPTIKIRIKKKSQLLIKLIHCFEPGNRSTLIMHYYPSFKKTVIQKLTNLSDPNSDDIRNSSRYFRQKIGETARKLLPHIHAIVSSTVLMQPVLKRIKVKGF